MPSGTVGAMVRDAADARQVTTWSRLTAAGLTPGRIRAELDAKRWQRWGHAIVLHNGPLTRRQQWQVARLHAGRGAVFTAFTAAEAAGLTGWERAEVHVLTRDGAHTSPRCPVPVRVHRTRTWSAVRCSGTSVVQVPAQALLIAAASFERPRPACGILAAGVQQRITTAAALTRELQRSPRLHHRALLRLAVADIAQGSDALSEIDFVRLCRRHRLPPPMQQAVRREPSGRRRYLDASWRRRDGRLVVAEVDGALHLSPRRWWDDQLRQNELMLADALVLRYPSVVIRTEHQLVATQLRRALLLGPAPVRPRIVSF